MSADIKFDKKEVHKYFSVACFNGAWDLIDKSERTTAEDEEMIRLSITSTWHWSQRDDCNEQNMSVGYWQTSRVYAILEQADNARKFGQLCLKASQSGTVAPFFLGYAYEALARAESVAGDQEKMEEYIKQAYKVADTIPDEDSKKALLADLESIE